MKTKSSRNRRSAFTIVEMLFAASISAFCMVAVIATFIMLYSNVSALTTYTNLNRQSRIALDKMSRDIRQAAALTNGTSTSLSFTNIDGKLLQYTYNSTRQLLTYTNASTGAGGTLLKNCTNCVFALYKTDPTTNTTMNFAGTTTATACKVVVLTWSCCQTNVRATVSEVVETAKIVMRN